MGITGVMTEGFPSPVVVPHVDCGVRNATDDCARCLNPATPQCGWCTMAAMCMQVGGHSPWSALPMCLSMNLKPAARVSTNLRSLIEVHLHLPLKIQILPRGRTVVHEGTRYVALLSGGAWQGSLLGPAATGASVCPTSIAAPFVAVNPNPGTPTASPPDVSVRFVSRGVSPTWVRALYVKFEPSKLESPG
jgi:hypothetical protein